MPEEHEVATQKGEDATGSEAHAQSSALVEPGSEQQESAQ